jgi:hypothetical protein
MGEGSDAHEPKRATRVALLIGALFAMSSPAAAHPLIDAPPDANIVIVSANLRESHAEWPDDITGIPYSDMQTMGELSNFVDHLAENLPSPPDVLLLQESSNRARARRRSACPRSSTSRIGS